MSNFFGNSMFGHNFQATAFQQNYGNSRGSFSSKKHSDSFGSSGFSHSGISSDHSGGHETLGMQRQHSILSEMTRSKNDKSENPWLFAHTPGHVEDGAVLKLYDKPLEKEKEKKKPVLTRQNTFGVETAPVKRAPSFASNPEKMRSRTISTSSVPDRFPLQRSMSIVDEPEEPLNMDRARPVLRRAMTIAADKERRKSEASLRPKKPLLHINLPKFGRRRSSTKSSPGTASSLSPNSETTSLSSLPMRSRSNTSDDPRRSPTSLKSQSKESPTSKSKENITDAEHEQAKLILSLLNPDPDDVFNQNNQFNDLHSKEQEPQKPSTKEPQSPSTVSKRFHQLLPPEQDNSSVHSDQFYPRADERSISSKSSLSIPASKSSSVSKPYPGKTFLLDAPILLPGEATDSESSESFYDCPTQNGIENGCPRKMRKKSPRHKRGSTSTCTDEDSNSTCDNNDPYEAETLPMRSRTVVPVENNMEPFVVPVISQPVKVRPTVRTYMYNSIPTKYENLMITVQNPVNERVSPKYEIKSESDPKDLHGTDTCTADSSESGYATSHKPLSPRDCDMKVLNFVNSLPSQPDINEEHSEVSHDDVLNGSETESDTEEPYSPISNLSNVKCASGSETDADSIRSNDTNSNLEVMKLLESPTEVSNRVENKLKTNYHNDNKTKQDDNTSDKFSMKRKNSDSSQTEVLRPYRKEEDHPDIVSEKSVKIHETPVQAECVVIAKENSSPQESPTTETHVIKHSDRSYHSFFERPLLSFRSTYSYENLSKCTQCVDLLLSCLNVLLFLTSAAVIALGLWLLLKNFNVNQMTEILGNNLLQVIIYLSIAGAAAAMLAALCLCCGMRQDKTGLGFYTFILILVIFSFATAAVLSAVFADKLGSIEFRFNFRDRLVHKYGLNNEKANQVFTESWDKMHQVFECCGVEGNENDTESWAVFKKFTKWYQHQPYKATIYVPESCCKRNANIEVCQGSDHSLLGPPVYGPPQEDYHTQTNPFLNTNGCYDLFAKHTTAVVAWTFLVTAGLAGLYFVVVMLTWVFCLKKPKEDHDNYDYESYYDVDTHNEVFDENDGTHLRHRGTKGSLKESDSLLSQPVTVHRMPPASADSDRFREMELGNPESAMTATSIERDSNGDIHDNRSDNEDSEDESGEEDPGMDQVENGSSRRNLWLTSELGYVHLLSVAIEEEEDNYEDSDEESSKPNMAFV